MARQDVVRALVHQDRLDTVLTALTDEHDIEPSMIEVSTPEPGTYRDERPELELHWLVRVGATRLAVSSLIGALVGSTLALLTPTLREYAPMTVLLMALTGAVAVGAVVTARTVQVKRDQDPRGEELLVLDPGEAERCELVTVRSVHDRGAVIDALTDLDAILLDSQYPRVGHQGAGERPAEPGDDEAGPPAP